MSIYKGTQLISGVATPIAPTKCIGQIVQSAIPLTDAGLHLSDGALINGNGIYGAFVEHISKLDQTLDCFTTEQEWQQSIINYGVCGKFVYDADANTVRLPKEYSDTRYLIDIYSSGANWYKIYSDGWCEQGGYWNGATDAVVAIPFLKEFKETPHLQMTRTMKTDSSGNATGVQVQTNTVYSITTSSFKTYGNAWSNSGVMWEAKGYIDVTAYKSAPLYKYIVVATGTKTDIEVNIDNVTTDLNQKVNKSDMTETPVIIEVSDKSLMPSWYRVYSDGWCEQGGISIGNEAFGITTIILLKPYNDTDYTISLGSENNTTEFTNANPASVRGASMSQYCNKTVSSFSVQSFRNVNWQTKGYIK